MWGHQHRWVSVSSRQISVYAPKPLGGYEERGSERTLVLKRCTQCGRYETDELRGWWTEAQLMIGVPVEKDVGVKS
jgi:hypothetical protein